MTVTTIPGVGLEIKRALDNQNKSTGSTAAPVTSSPSAATSGTATLPTDTVSVRATMPVDNDTLEQIAAQNRDAASSVLSDDDLEALSEGTTPQQQVLAQAKASTAAQTNRLPPSMLQLLME